MKVSRAKAILEELDDEAEIYFYFEVKDEVEEVYLEYNLDMPNAEFTEDEWLDIVNTLDSQENIWEEIKLTIENKVDTILRERAKIDQKG